MMNMIDKEKIDQIHTMIRLKQDGYKDIKCPCCGEHPYIERSINTPGFLLIRCKCGLLNMSERGI